LRITLRDKEGRANSYVCLTYNALCLARQGVAQVKFTSLRGLPAGGSKARELWKPKGFRYDVDVKFLPVAI